MEDESKEPAPTTAQDDSTTTAAPPAQRKQAQARESIQTLTSISQDLPTLLHSAGSALALLSTNPAASTAASNATSTEAPPAPPTLEQRQSAFATHVTEYYTNLNNIQTLLLKQVDLLEEARILPATAAEQPQVDDTGDGVEGGYGGAEVGRFDVAWLNARARDVARSKERELVRDARRWMAAQNGTGNGDATNGQGSNAQMDTTDAMEE